MKIATITTLAAVALLVTGVAAVAVGSSGEWGQQNNDWKGINKVDFHWNHHSCNSFSPSETLTVSGLTGFFRNATGFRPRGTANGSFTFQVSNTYATGCTFSITSGTIKLNTTSYSVSGGVLVMSRGGHGGSGMGTISSGSFLIQVSGLQGNSTSARVGSIGLDLKTGSSEFLVQLHGAFGHHMHG